MDMEIYNLGEIKLVFHVADIQAVKERHMTLKVWLPFPRIPVKVTQQERNSQSVDI